MVWNDHASERAFPSKNHMTTLLALKDEAKLGQDFDELLARKIGGELRH
jgi:hypothetical protein